LKIPDSLYKAGLDDEALEWCSIIMDDYSNRKKVVKAIQRKREEKSKHSRTMAPGLSD